MSKFTKIGQLFLLPSLLLLLTSCGYRLNYYYNSIRYDTPEEAIEAQKKDIEITLGSIKATVNQAGGSALVILPSKTYIKKNVNVKWKGLDPGPELKEKLLDFKAAQLDIDYNALGRYIEKRRIFDSVAITNSDDPQGADFSEIVALKLFKKEEKMR